MASGCQVNWKSNIQSNYRSLLESIDTDNGLFGELRKLNSDTFHPRVVKRIWDIPDVTKRICELLNHIQKGDDNRFSYFCHALRENGQSHIVEKFLLKGASCRDSGGGCGDNVDAVMDELDLPLSKTNARKLTSHWNKLVDDIDSHTESGLLDELENRKVLTTLQIRQLKGIQFEAERNESLLKYVERGSERHFVEFCNALLSTSHLHLVNLMNSTVQTAGAVPLPPSMTSSSTETNCNAAGLKKPIPVSSSFEQCSIETSLQSVDLKQNSSVRSPVNSAVIENHSPVLPAVNQQPKLEVVEKMRQQIDEHRAYNVSYHPDRPSVKRGHAVIIANEFFSTAKLRTRYGTDADIKWLQSLFAHLKFDVDTYQNFTAPEIKSLCERESKSDVQSSIFVLCILSHGKNGAIFGSDGSELGLDEIMTIFDGKNCRRFLNKPKLFFVQACQGDLCTEGVDDSDAMQRDDELDADAEAAEEAPKILSQLSLNQAPNTATHEKADMAIVLATYPGYAAWRNPNTGSYFIQQLNTVFLQRAHQDHFADMTTEVIRTLNRCVMAGNHKQICQIQSTLDKFVYLLPY